MAEYHPHDKLMTIIFPALGVDVIAFTCKNDGLICEVGRCLIKSIENLTAADERDYYYGRVVNAMRCLANLLVKVQQYADVHYLRELCEPDMFDTAIHAILQIGGPLVGPGSVRNAAVIIRSMVLYMYATYAARNLHREDELQLQELAQTIQAWLVIFIIA